MSSHTHDEAFHEIQLNGKQLVFLFMAATVVSVVIFLCGVLVGRGVRAERSAIVDVGLSESAPVEPVLQRQPSTQAAPPAAQAGADPTAAAPPPAVDDLSYFKRLEKPNASAENLKAATPSPAKPAAAPEKTTATRAAKAAPAARAAAAAAPAKDSGGFAVQVAALNARGEADAIAKRLTSKGYAAYVMTPADGTPNVFRVRVGKFPTRREAESIASKLQKEEQFKPWITR